MSSNGPPNKQFFIYYKAITIDHNLVSGSGNHTNFPVLISIFDSDLHDNVQSNGNDIAFANESAWLDHEIELFDQTYNSTHAQLIAWVRIPSLSTSVDTIIRMYYGNSTITNQENPAGVWNGNYKGVWHLPEDPSGAAPQIKDSTSNYNHGTVSNLDTDDQENGQIDGSIDFDDNQDHIDCGNDSSLNMGSGEFSLSMWFNYDGVDWGAIAGKGAILQGKRYYLSFNTPAGQIRAEIDDDNVAGRDIVSAENYGDDLWHHLVMVRDEDYLRLYIDGIEDGTRSVTGYGNIDSVHPFYMNAICGDNSGQITSWSSVKLDEVRVSSLAHSADWIATEFDNQNDPNSFYSIGEEYLANPLNDHYFTYYKEIIIHHSMVSGFDDLLNFPILISCFDKDLHDNVQQSNGNDIAFSDGITWLDHEIEHFNQGYNTTHAELITWVRIPSLSNSVDTIIYMYYGNSTMDSRENSENVWDNSYKGIWHLKENPTAPAPQFLDSTSYNNDGTAFNLFSSNRTSGKIDGGLIFNDENEACVNISDANSLDLSTDMTISAWVKTNDAQSDVDVVITKWSPTPPNQNYWLGKLNSNDFAFYVDSTQNVITNLNLINDNSWHYVVGVADSLNSLLRIYVDGIERNTAVYSGSSQTGNHYLNIGKSSGIIEQEWNGKIDEVRVINTVRSADWLATEYNNQYDTINFYSIGKEYTVSGNPPNQYDFIGYKEIIIDNLMVSGSNDLLNFPFLVSIFDEDLHETAQEDGDDIAFAYSGAWLDHEIELFNQTYNSSHAQLITWVSIPRLSASLDTVIRMYYGNSTMSSRENPNEVWTNNYKGVWHLSESTGSALDSTSHGTSGSVSGTVTRDPKGKIDSAYNFGNNGQINFGNPPDGHLDMGTGSFTISFWLNIDDSTGNYQLPLYKGATTDSETGYDFETSMTAESLNFRITDGTGVVSTPGLDIEFDSWMYVVGVVDRTSNFIKLFQNGLLVGSGTSITGVGNIDNDLPLVAPSATYDLDGFLDEIRISKTAHSADWIATEYNNQYDPQSFLTISLEYKFDDMPPTYSNLIEGSNPLELGETEVITINVSDPSGINSVKIDFMGSNHSMANIGGDTWQYDSWTPSSVGNYSYTIWMEDNYNNWNSTMGVIEVIDTTPPTYSDLIESADPLQLGQNETITIKVYDSPGSGVNQTILEYDSSNHTMSFIGGNTWSWNKWKPSSSGSHSYKIFMQDMENNWNMTSGNITVVSTTAPVIENLTESETPLELGNNIIIMVDVFDNETFVEAVLIELDGTNHTMTNTTIGNTYEFNWTRSYVGIVYYTIYANDTDNNWNSLSSSFDIVDTTPPAFSGIAKSEDPLELGNTVIISVNSTDLADIYQVRIEYMGSNHSMTNISVHTWQFDSWIPDSVGNHTFTIWAEDNNNNWGFISDSVLVRDTTAPIYSDLTESADPVELGDLLVISINSTDLANIKDVLIECENSNHTMANTGGDIWEYTSWMPTSIGNYTYKIYIIDNNDNMNYVSSSILFQDTIIPVYSNLFESVDPLELGDNPTIRIDINDFAGIYQALIEFEGVNHSMTNIYGNTWHYDSWTPNNWITYQYIIYMEDNSDNWNFVIANITVQDTTSPSLPVFANSPSGDVSGTLVFDWEDGNDPSGILYYILIIDNETDPYATPGYVHIFNTTNVGSNSSYYELSEVLPLGRYYYFLAQIDGVGHQSSFTMGTFTVVSIDNGTPGNNNLMIIVIIALVSVIGSVAAIVIVRKKLKKDITPPRKKISLKIISSHMNKLSSSEFAFQAEEFQAITSEGIASKQLTDERELENRINEIRTMGEELFADGAYLEAQEQFKLGRDLLLNLGRVEEANLFSELIFGIEGIIAEREKRLEILEETRIKGDSEQIFDLYQDIIDISKKLRDPDGVSFYQSELIQYFQINKLGVVDLETYRFNLNQKAESSFNSNIFEIAAQLYEKCEKISQLLVQLGRDEEVAKIEEFRLKKNESLKRVS